MEYVTRLIFFIYVFNKLYIIRSGVIYFGLIIGKVRLGGESKTDYYKRTCYPAQSHKKKIGKANSVLLSI